jgi:hypothetical protein
MRIMRALRLATAVGALSLALAVTGIGLGDPAFAGQKNKHKNRSTFGPAHMIPGQDKPKGPLKGNINADFSPTMPHKRVTGHGGGGKHKIRSGRQGGGRNLDAAGALIDMLGTAAGIAGGGSHQ